MARAEAAAEADVAVPTPKRPQRGEGLPGKKEKEMINSPSPFLQDVEDGNMSSGVGG